MGKYPSTVGQQKEETMTDVTASLGKGGESETCSYDFGADLDNAVEKFGAEVVFANFRAQATIGLQAFMRNSMRLTDSEGKLTPVRGKALQKEVTAWTPGEKKPARSPVEKAKDQMGKLTPEQRAALFAEFKAA